MRGRLFDHLARYFSPAPKKVLAAELAYAQAPGDDLAALAHTGTLAALPSAAHHALWRLAALYPVHSTPGPGGGLRVKGRGELSRLETRHIRFVPGRVVHSRALSALL